MGGYSHGNCIKSQVATGLGLGVGFLFASDVSYEQLFWRISWGRVLVEVPTPVQTKKIMSFFSLSHQWQDNTVVPRREHFQMTIAH
jgi:hypothetical protein